MRDASDAAASSARLDACKPESGIFRAALAAAGVPSAAAQFVDDTPGHVAAAQALGFHGHRFEVVARLEAAPREAGLLTEVPASARSLTVRQLSGRLAERLAREVRGMTERRVARAGSPLD